jgi:hypothetical protein
MINKNHRYYLQTLNERGIPVSIDGFASRQLAKVVAAHHRTEFVVNSRTGRVWLDEQSRWVPLEFYASVQGFLSELAPSPLWDKALNRVGSDLGLHMGWDN